MKNPAEGEGGPNTSFVLERNYDASRELVYKAWTDPALVSLWWGIEGSSSVVNRMDVRPLGAWSIDTHLPGGASFPNTGFFRTVIENELLEFSQRVPADVSAADDCGAEVWHRVSFREADAGGTRVEIVVTAPTQDVRDRLVLSGMADGMSQGLDRLERVLSNHANAGK